jgi:FdhD protein
MLNFANRSQNLMNSKGTERVTINRRQGSRLARLEDDIAVEEPLEIKISHKGETRVVSITMRTPGNDEDLAVGFLFTEGIIRQKKDVGSVFSEGLNSITVGLNSESKIDLKNLERHFYTSSSCGVCGKTSIEALQAELTFQGEGKINNIGTSVLYGLQKSLREAQTTFESTGGIHAAAIFDRHGTPLSLREDVGRHNALDKIVGNSFLKDMLPIDDGILLLSGRASFELIQNAAMAGIKVVAAIGAPSSLAVTTAEKFGISLIGFLKEDRFNVYTGLERISSEP